MANDPAADRWQQDLTVLRTVFERKEAHPNHFVTEDEVAEDTGLTIEEVRQSAKRLQLGGYVKMLGAWSSDAVFQDITGPALTAVGAWPTPETALDRMIAALESIAANTEADEDTRTRARKVLDGLAGAGRTVGLTVAAAAITGQLPGH